ncbi:hypothetical protein, partial [Streptomyces chryseus]|uniref:hypothetical protein n=1 Tax=Streptomyces chryseus TaxID=68186 RepID=UPI001AC00775
ARACGSSFMGTGRRARVHERVGRAGRYDLDYERGITRTGAARPAAGAARAGHEPNGPARIGR